MASTAGPIPSQELTHSAPGLRSPPNGRIANSSQNDRGAESEDVSWSDDDELNAEISDAEIQQRNDVLASGARNAATITTVPPPILKIYKNDYVKSAFQGWWASEKGTLDRKALDRANKKIRDIQKTPSGTHNELEIPIDTILEHFTLLKQASPLDEKNQSVVKGASTFIATMVRKQVPFWNYVPSTTRKQLQVLMSTSEMRDALEELIAQNDDQNRSTPSSEQNKILAQSSAGVVALLKDSNEASALHKRNLELAWLNIMNEQTMIDHCIPVRELTEASREIGHLRQKDPLWKDAVRNRLQSLKDFLEARGLPAEAWISESEMLQALEQRPQSPQAPQSDMFISELTTPTSLRALTSFNTSSSAESEPLRPGYTRDGKLIIATRRVGDRGRQFIIKTGAETGAEYEIRTGVEVGSLASKAYMNQDNKVELGMYDARYTKDKADKFVAVIGAVYKPVDTATRGIFRLPATTGIVQFSDEEEPAILSRTVLRRVLGKKDADIELRNYFLRRGVVPPEDMPPQNFREPRQSKWAQSGQQSTMTQLIPAQSNIPAQPIPAQSISAQSVSAQPTSAQFEQQQAQLDSIQTQLATLMKLMSAGQSQN